jgi:polysaccharide export outer membrane protein
MKKSTRSSLLVFLYPLYFVATLASCTTAKQLTYLQDAPPNQTIKGAPKAPPVYKIRVGDNLFVSITSQDLEMNKIIDPANGNQNAITYEGAASRALNGNVVYPNGTIQLPMLGNVKVEGKTIPEAEEQIRAATKDFLKDVSVKVRVLTYKITVVGEVKVPGVYYNYNSYITIFDAIGLAQGTTDFAKLADVLVVRNTPAGARTYALNLTSRSALASDAYYLEPGDVVMLQPGKNKGLQQKLPFATVLVGAASAFLLLLNYIK